MNREEMKDAWIDFLFSDIKERAIDAGAYKVENSYVGITVAGQHGDTILFLRTYVGLYVFFEYIIIYEKDGEYDCDLANEKIFLTMRHLFVTSSLKKNFLMWTCLPG